MVEEICGEAVRTHSEDVECGLDPMYSSDLMGVERGAYEFVLSQGKTLLGGIHNHSKDVSHMLLTTQLCQRRWKTRPVLLVLFGKITSPALRLQTSIKSIPF